jgi:hypothetical protein
MYQLLKDPRTNEVCAVLVVGTNMSIPLDEDNTDYQAYLAWVAEGNTAEEWTGN